MAKGGICKFGRATSRAEEASKRFVGTGCRVSHGLCGAECGSDFGRATCGFYGVTQLLAGTSNFLITS